MRKKVLLTPKQTCELLQVSRQTLRNWERSGDITAIKMGGTTRYVLDTQISNMETEQSNENQTQSNQ